jgi:hypothetical protein
LTILCSCSCHSLAFCDVNNASKCAGGEELGVLLFDNKFEWTPDKEPVRFHWSFHLHLLQVLELVADVRKSISDGMTQLAARKLGQVKLAGLQDN